MEYLTVIKDNQKIKNFFTAIALGVAPEQIEFALVYVGDKKNDIYLEHCTVKKIVLIFENSKLEATKLKVIRNNGTLLFTCVISEIKSIMYDEMQTAFIPTKKCKHRWKHLIAKFKSTSKILPPTSKTNSDNN